MILKSARVQKFKSAEDSGDFTLLPAVTCLVGKNESGKTALLEALYRLNPVPTGHQQKFEPLLDYPRGEYAADKEADVIDDTEPIQTVFELEADDITTLENEFGAKAFKDKTVRVSKNYANTRLWAYSVDEVVVLRKLAKDAAVPAMAVGCKTLDDLRAKATEAGAQPPEAAALLQKLSAFDLSESVIDALSARLPKFLYFDDYSIMAGRVSIPRLQQSPPELKPEERTALALLKLAGVATSDFTVQYEERKAALEAAANNISDEVFTYWSQNKQLAVEFDVDFAVAGDPSGLPAPFLEVRIKNQRHRVTLRFDRRSAGFVWFFSFLAAFSEYRRSKDRLVLLLDEPGLGLHAAAQGDLLRYIDERLAPSHQVIYTTHSAWMIKPNELQRVRTVEDVEQDGKLLGTKVSADILATNKDTVSPLAGALGIELSQTLFVGPDNLVVEGPADYLYLTILSDQLGKAKRTQLNTRWVIVPAGGLDKVPAFVALFGAQLNVVVMVDSRTGALQRLNDMINRGLLAPNKLIPISNFTGTSAADIEDMFDSDFYLDLVKASGAAPVTKAALKPGKRIVQRIEDTIGKKYDHYVPARYFLENQVNLASKLDAATLDRFEKLFQQINPLLSK